MEQDLITGVRFFGAASLIFIAILVALINRGRVQSDVYEKSRWFICAATMLLGIHNLIQFFGHFREESVTLCWTINLAFYVVVTPLYNMGELNLLRAGRGMKSRYIRNIAFILLCYAIFAIGYSSGTLINDEAPWLTATFAVAILYFMKLLELSVSLRKEMLRTSRRLTDEELEERHEALHYTARSMNWVIIFSLLTPWPGMTSSLLLNSVFGLVVMGLLIWFVVRFLTYGNNMAGLIDVTNEITEAQMIEEEAKVAPSIQEDTHSLTQQRIEQWVEQCRYTNPSVTLDSALKEMGISVTSLNFYLEQHTKVTNYRQWLPYLRIEEAKRIMLEHPEYSFDTIAESCGYSNKSNFSRAFKAHEGITPGQWLSAQSENK